MPRRYSDTIQSNELIVDSQTQLPSIKVFTTFVMVWFTPQRR